MCNNQPLNTGKKPLKFWNLVQIDPKIHVKDHSLQKSHPFKIVFEWISNLIDLIVPPPPHTYSGLPYGDVAYKGEYLGTAVAGRVRSVVTTFVEIKSC